MNNLLELVLKRRSTRKFKKNPISKEILNEILTVALTAPSSWGSHPIHFFVNMENITFNGKFINNTAVYGGGICVQMLQ